LLAVNWTYQEMASLNIYWYHIQIVELLFQGAQPSSLGSKVARALRGLFGNSVAATEP
jgi:hypothetical protein